MSKVTIRMRLCVSAITLCALPQGLLTDMIRDARSKGELHTRDWKTVPVFGLAVACADQSQPLTSNTDPMAIDTPAASSQATTDKQPACHNTPATGLLSDAMVPLAQQAPPTNIAPPIVTSQIDAQVSSLPAFTAGPNLTPKQDIHEPTQQPGSQQGVGQTASQSSAVSAIPVARSPIQCPALAEGYTQAKPMGIPSFDSAAKAASRAVTHADMSQSSALSGEDRVLSMAVGLALDSLSHNKPERGQSLLSKHLGQPSSGSSEDAQHDADHCSCASPSALSSSALSSPRANSSPALTSPGALSSPGAYPSPGAFSNPGAISSPALSSPEGALYGSLAEVSNPFQRLQVSRPRRLHPCRCSSS